MRIVFKAVLLTILSLTACTVFKPQPVPRERITEEMRGIWITRFDWVKKDSAEMAAHIRTIMKEVAEHNFNTVFFQVRGAAETLYPSPLEPWSKLLNEQDPGFDPVQLAIQEAHRQGLEFHAYINLMPLRAGTDRPKDTSHLYYRHGPEVPEEKSWVVFDSTGKPMELLQYYYLNPAIPGVRVYLEKVIRHFVQTYNIEGLHFDRIRYPGEHFLYDPLTILRHRQDSLETGITRKQWARDALTGLVESVVSEALLIKPYLHISAATWGLHRTVDFENYASFKSGYEHYYQDAIGWLDAGIMDFIVPMMYWDFSDPRPNFDEVWSYFRNAYPQHAGHIIPGLYAKEEWIESSELFSQMQHVRNTGGRGTVLFSYNSLKAGEGFDPVRNQLYANRVRIPENLRRTEADDIFSLQLLDESGTPLADEAVRIDDLERGRRTSAEGWLNFILPGSSRRLNLETESFGYQVGTGDFELPYKYAVTPGGRTMRKAPWVEMRRHPGRIWHDPSFNLLCKSDYPVKTFINGDSVKQYTTGIFFDRLGFNEGLNRYRAEALYPDSGYVLYERQVLYTPEEPEHLPGELWIDSASVSPAVDLMLQSDDKVIVSFRGTPGCLAELTIPDAGIEQPFSRLDRDNSAVYQTGFFLRDLEEERAYPFHITLYSEEREDEITYRSPVTIMVQSPEDFPLVRTKTSQAVMTYNRGQIRLGGPVIAEYPEGVILQTSGKAGDDYRIRLDAITEGFIDGDDVEVLPGSSVQPGYYIRSVSAAPENQADIVRIPYPECVPYAVLPEPELKRIRISLFGVKTTSTWITHRDSLQVIDRVTWEQTTPETYTVFVTLKTEKIWGYNLKKQEGYLEFSVKHPPSSLSAAQDSLFLEGLSIAIEAGHGGGNTGATGLSGLLEKDINLDVALQLESICRENGMQVVQVRSEDTGMYLSEKRRIIEESDADLAVSIHANATGRPYDYLGVSGTSTYYHNPFWEEFAGFVYRRLLELKLDEFGMVGSFNYRVIRLSSRPVILVEQAFMSHAEDEEKLASPEFRRELAEKVFLGIQDYVRFMLEE